MCPLPTLSTIQGTLNLQLHRMLGAQSRLLHRGCTSWITAIPLGCLECIWESNHLAFANDVFLLWNVLNGLFGFRSCRSSSENLLIWNLLSSSPLCVNAGLPLIIIGDKLANGASVRLSFLPRLIIRPSTAVLQHPTKSSRLPYVSTVANSESSTGYVVRDKALANFARKIDDGRGKEIWPWISFIACLLTSAGSRALVLLFSLSADCLSNGMYQTR